MIETILAAHAASEARVFEGRNKTVGASEIGQCARKIFYVKNGAPQNGERAAWGWAARGNLIENHFLVPAFRKQFGERFLFAGDDQRSFQVEELSATPDGLLVDLQPDELSALGLPAATTAVVVEFKTVDPRVLLDEPKPEHAMQVQAQIGTIWERTNHRPTHGLLFYVNASDLSVREFIVEADPRIYAVCKQRARKIMEANDVAEISPEGSVAGGKECEVCAFKQLCGLARLPGLDNDPTTLAPEIITQVAELGREIMRLDAQADAAAIAVRERKEEMRDRLRELGVRRVKSEGISIVWAQVKGRTSIDTDALRAAGIDVSKFEKQRAPSERLTVKPTS